MVELRWRIDIHERQAAQAEYLLDFMLIFWDFPTSTVWVDLPRDVFCLLELCAQLGGHKVHDAQCPSYCAARRTDRGTTCMFENLYPYHCLSFCHSIAKAMYSVSN